MASPITEHIHNTLHMTNGVVKSSNLRTNYCLFWEDVRNGCPLDCVKVWDFILFAVVLADCRDASHSDLMCIH